MSQPQEAQPYNADVAPGDAVAEDEDPGASLLVYSVGLGLALFLTFVSFYLVHTKLVWAPSIPVALCVLAVAQMGVHLVFFIHLTSGPDNTNNVMALAFGVLIVFLVIGGSLFIMSHMNQNMAIPMNQVMQMQR
jgi:cytochrome o ubiquinol oxidase operon protein cyoD